jgi:hypothetical protein
MAQKEIVEYIQRGLRQSVIDDVKLYFLLVMLPKLEIVIPFTQP